MSQTAPAQDENYVLTLEEIANLAAEGGKSAETLMNVVALIAKRFQTDVCSAYLLEPDRANLVLAATLGLRPQCIGTLRMGIHEGLAGLVAERVGPVAVEQVKNHPRFKYFSEAGEESYQSFLGVPLIDRGVLQGVLVVQTIAPRVFREDEVRMLTEAAAQVGSVVSEARTLDRFIAPAQERLWALARNLWWCWDHDTSSLFRDLDPVRWRQLNHNPVALLSEIPLAVMERRARELVLHSRINYAYRRQREYLDADRTWGARHAGILRPRPGSVLLGRIRFARFHSGVFRRTGRSRRRSHQERVRFGYPARGHRIVLWTGIFPAKARPHRLAAGRIHSDGCQSAAHGSRHRSEWRARHHSGGDSRRTHPGESLAHEGRTLRSSFDRLQH